MLIVIAFSFLSAVNATKCINKHTQNTALIDQFASGVQQDNSFLEAYYKSKEMLSCNCNNNQLSEIVSSMKDDIKPKLDKQCVKRSMANLPNTLKSTNRILCKRNGQSSRPLPIKSKSQDLCIDEEVVNYVSWAVNEAIDCVNSITDSPVQPEITFMKLNRESKFGFYLQYNGGIGIAQMTTAGVNGVAENAPELIEKAKTSKQCESFHELLSKPLQYTKSGSVRHCQLLGIGEGVGRNLFLGLALLVHHRDTGVNALAKWFNRRGVTDKDKINYLSFISYGRNGYAASKDAFDVIRYKAAVQKDPKLKSNYNQALAVGSEIINNMPMDQFLELLDDKQASEYIYENFTSLREFYRTHYGITGDEFYKTLAGDPKCV